MLLKIYYELQEYEVLDSFLHSFNVFLQRKKLIGYHKEKLFEYYQVDSKVTYG